MRFYGSVPVVNKRHRFSHPANTVYDRLCRRTKHCAHHSETLNGSGKPAQAIERRARALAARPPMDAKKVPAPS